MNRTEIMKAAIDNYRSNQAQCPIEPVDMCSDFSRDAVQSDIYEIIEWLTFEDVPTLEEVMATKTGSGMMQAARIEAHKAAEKIRSNTDMTELSYILKSKESQNAAFKALYSNASSELKDLNMKLMIAEERVKRLKDNIALVRVRAIHDT